MAQTMSLSNGAASSSSGTTFAAGGEDVLRTLLQQLLGGGTPEQRAEQQRRVEEINAVRQQRGDYSKEAAFADSEAVSARESRLALEKLVPSINRAAEGAGTSASSMRALLLQDAAQKAAESAAALGLKASTDYGSIATSLSGVLQGLTQQTNPITKALIDALAISKGQNSTSVGDSRTSVNSSSGSQVMGQVGLSPSQTGWAGTGLDKPFVRTPDPVNYGEQISAEEYRRIYGNNVGTPVGWNGFGSTSLGELVQVGNNNIRGNTSSGNEWTGDSWSDVKF